MNGPAGSFRPARPSVGVAFLRLYRGDVLFKSSLDFAAIGLFVYLFVAPLPLPMVWDPTPANPASHTAAPQAASVSDVAQAAKVPSKRKAEEPLNRRWFSLSDAKLLPVLNEAADALDEGHITQAFGILEPVKNSDDPNVLFLLAISHLSSRAKDAAQRGYEFHLKAANRGHPLAMNEVGQMLRLGAAGEVDLPAAVDWYERGAALGEPDAAAQAGRAYVHGWARPIDHVKALAYYKQAAEAGHAFGMHNYGAVLVNGEGATADAAEGRKWIEKAATAGLPTAQYSLAVLYRDGVGGPQDQSASIEWMQKSADQGHAPALYELGMHYLKPADGSPPDIQRAAGYLRQAAMKKNGSAAFAFATLYERGTGVKASNVQAFVYYTIALRAGEATAQQRLDDLRSKMTSSEIETAQGLAAATSDQPAAATGLRAGTLP